MAPRGGGAPAPLVAATRADGRAHGVGRSLAPLRAQERVPGTNGASRCQKTFNFN